MGKTHKLKINSTDYIAPKIEPRENFKKKNIKFFIVINWKILLVFLIFTLMSIIGIILTSIGLVNRTSPTDFGNISIYSTIACIGIIFFLISLLSYILLIPIAYRFTKKIIEKRKSSKIIKNH